MLYWVVTEVILWSIWNTSAILPSGHIPEIKNKRAACELIVDAGPDISICLPGTVELMGSVTGEAIFTIWSPPNGLSDPSILNPEADIAGTITYTLTGWGIDPNNPNIIDNGDFESGNTGFTSDYVYVTDQPIIQDEMVPAGTYTVINNPFLVHEAWSPCADHTPDPDDQMMLINGELALQNFWCQTVSVLSNTWYNIEAWVSSVHPSSPAVLSFSINGVPIGPTINAPGTPCEWIPFNATWNSGSETSIEICIINLNTEAFGNDFALDDITMVALCEMEDEVTITVQEEPAPVPVISGPASLCVNETGVYTSSLPSEPEVLNYFWTVPSGTTIITGQGTPEIQIEADDAVTGTVCLMIETACDESENCYEIVIGQLPDPPSITGPFSLCPGETGVFSTEIIDPEHEYNWIIPPIIDLVSGEGTNEIIIEWAAVGEAEICLEITNECGTTVECHPLQLYQDYFTVFDTVLCEGTTILINGTEYGNGNWSGTENFISTQGCDSIVDITITEADALEFMNEVTLCPGDSVFLEGEYQFEEGMYVDSYTTLSGCDSIIFTEVFVSLFDTTWIISTTCDPDEATMQIETYSSGNCDSTVITTIFFIAPDTTLITLSSCVPADTGQIVISLTNQAGCDSIIITNTIFQLSDTTRLFHTSCDLSEVGVDIQTLTNVNGCDSIVITTVIFSLSDTTTVQAITCVLIDTITTSELLTNINGCDSLVIYQNIYGGSDTTFLFSSSCSAIDTGLLVSNLLNQHGCDSVVLTYVNFLQADTTYLMLTSCNPLDTGLLMESHTNATGCDSLVITHTLLENPDLCALLASFSVEQPLCAGDTAMVNIEITTGLSPFTLQWSYSGSSGTYDFPTEGNYTIPFPFEGEVYIELLSANGFSLFDTILMNQPDPLEIDAVVENSNGGFGVPCYGDTGEAQLYLLSEGTPPLIIQWSTGDTSMHVDNLTPGLYTVSVTDDHNCIASDSILINEPPPINYDIEIQDISCFGLDDGQIIISGLEGGVTPWMILVNGEVFPETLHFEDLPVGNYDVIIRDANGCEAKEYFELVQPGQWSIGLGGDTIVEYGTLLTLLSHTSGQPAGDIQIDWSDGQCENCIVREIEVTDNIMVGIMATDENGCTSEDVINLEVVIPQKIFIPNVFSPNGDEVNDYFFISSNSFIEEIEELSIFDRWGNLVFQHFHFPPNDPLLGWDGSVRYQALNPAVFAYKVIVLFRDGQKKVFHGDVTLVR